jgi:hypothetical protein
MFSFFANAAAVAASPTVSAIAWRLGYNRTLADTP